MERELLINKVKTRMDEVSASGDLIVEVDIENTKPYDSIIDDLLDEAAMEILLKAPIYRLNVTSGKESITPIVDINDEKIGSFALPEDFVRLVYFKMEKWLQPVVSFAFPGDEIAIRQANKHIRGYVAKPVGVLYSTNYGNTVHYYSVPSKDDHVLESFLYIKECGATEIEDAQMIDAMCWICAGKALGVLGEKGLSDICYENAKGLMV